MTSARRSRSLLLVSALLGAVPVIFGVIRAVTTGDDFRYLWLAGAAVLGSAAVVAIGHAGLSVGRGVGAIVAGAGGAAAAALLQGATAGPGVAIVAIGFGLCTGISGVLASLACRSRPA
jgi:hypothetical protein